MSLLHSRAAGSNFVLYIPKTRLFNVLTFNAFYDMVTFMKLRITGFLFLYSCVAALTFVTGIKLWFYFDEQMTYQIVTVFISIIILSNCFAKLFAIIVYREIP